MLKPESHEPETTPPAPLSGNAPLLQRLRENQYRTSLQTESLVETARLVNDARGLREVYEVAFRRLAEMMSFDEGLLLAPPDAAGAMPASYRFLSSVGEMEEAGWQTSAGSLARLFAENEPVNFAAVAKSADPSDHALGAAGIQSFLAVPVSCEEQPAAALCVARHDTVPFSAGDRQCLEITAVQLAVALTRERVQARLHATAAQLQATQAVLDQRETSHALGTMASGIVRDINSALLPVLGYAELLLALPVLDADPAKTRHYLKLIHASAAGAAGILSRLTNFYRPAGPEARLSVDLNSLIRAAIEMTRSKWESIAQAAGIEIRTRLTLADIPPVSGYAGELTSGLTEFILHAVDALDKVGGVISIRTRADGDNALIELGWSGIGTAKPEAGAPFALQDDQPAVNGLRAFYRAVERHGGTIDCELLEGRGVMYMITLPLAIQVEVGTAAESNDAVESAAMPTEIAAHPKGTFSVREQLTAAPPRQKLKIMVVDDEPMLREMLTDILTLDGHLVMVARDGQDALARFKPDYYDLVITDRSMPKMNGDQLAAALKAIDPAQMVFMLTGFGQLMNAAAERPAGVDRIISKPVGGRDLRAALQQLPPRAAPSISPADAPQIVGAQPAAPLPILPEQDCSHV